MADTTGKPNTQSNSFIKTFFIVIGVAVLTTVITVWLTLFYLFPTRFTPVSLNYQEQVALDSKLKALNIDLDTKPVTGKDANRVLEPQRYTEESSARVISFSERELNALIATNTDLASKVAIDLSPGLVSALILVPLDPEMPILGGKTLKITAGVGLSYKNYKPIVVLKGVSLWGVPVPNAWLGNMKNVDLVQEYGNEGFWQAFAAGVDQISVNDGSLTVRLKE